MLENLSTLERIDAALHLLDQMPDSKGRERCAQICVIGDILDSVKRDVIELLKNQPTNNTEEPEIEIVGVVPEEPAE